MPERELYQPDKNTGLSKIGYSAGKHFRSIGLRAALPLSAILLTVAAACAKGEGDKLGGEESSENFADKLPAELFDACREYVQSETVGDSHDQTGFALSTQYLQEHPNDNKALYLASSGALFLAGFQEARLGFETVQESGLPDKQNEIARDIVDGLDVFIGSEGKILDDPEELDKALDALFTPMADLRTDLENNICPEGTERPAEKDDEQSVERRYAYRDLLDNLLTDDGTNYSIPTAAQLQNYDYQHIADVQEVTQAIKNSALTLEENKDSFKAAFLINYAITISAKYMSENHQLGVSTDTLNGAQVLLDVLQDENYTLITYQLAPNGVREKLIYFLGDEEGEKIFSELGAVILDNLDNAQGQRLWNRLTVEDQLLIEP